MLALSRENEMTHKDYFSFSLWIFAYQVNGVSKYMWSMQHNNRHRHKTISFILSFFGDDYHRWKWRMKKKNFIQKVRERWRLMLSFYTYQLFFCRVMFNVDIKLILLHFILVGVKFNYLKDIPIQYLFYPNLWGSVTYCNKTILSGKSSWMKIDLGQISIYFWSHHTLLSWSYQKRLGKLSYRQLASH